MQLNTTINNKLVDKYKKHALNVTRVTAMKALKYHVKKLTLSNTLALNKIVIRDVLR